MRVKLRRQNMLCNMGFHTSWALSLCFVLFYTACASSAGASRGKLPCTIPDGTVFTCTYYKPGKHGATLKQQLVQVVDGQLSSITKKHYRHNIGLRPASRFTRNCTIDNSAAKSAKVAAKSSYKASAKVVATACQEGGKSLPHLKYLGSDRGLCPAAECNKLIHQLTWSFEDTTLSGEDTNIVVKGPILGDATFSADGATASSAVTTDSQASAVAQSLVDYVTARNPAEGPRALLALGASLPSAVYGTAGSGLSPVLNVANDLVSIGQNENAADVVKGSANLGCMIAMVVIEPAVPLGTFICTNVLSAFINAFMSILGGITPPFTCNSDPSLVSSVQVDGSIATPCGSDYVGAPACGAPFTITYACPRDINGCLTTTAADCEAGYVSQAQDTRSAVASDTVAFQALSSGLANACRCYAAYSGMTYTDPNLSAAFCPICKPGYAALGSRGCSVGVGSTYVPPAILGAYPICTCGMATPCPAGFYADPVNCVICKTCNALCCSQMNPNRCMVQPADGCPDGTDPHPGNC